MKKLMFFAGALLALATLAACDKSAQEPELVSYNITVDASRDASLSKAISLSGSTMNAIWGSTDKVAVYNSANTKIGTLTPQSTGSASTVLKGSITASGISAGTKLRLLAPRDSWLYSGQAGTLSGVSSKYAYASAEVTVSAVNGSDIQTSPAAFKNEQAIVKFTLVDAGGAPVKPDELLISSASGKLVRSFNASLSALTGDISVVPDDDTNVLYVALRNDSGAADTYNLTATVGKFEYNANKAGVNFQNGKYYAGTVTMQLKQDTYTVAGSPAAIFGTEWDAENTANDMVRQSDGTYLKVYNVKQVSDVSFKVVKNHEWGSAGTNNWPAEGNVALTVGAGELKIMFDPDRKKVSYTYIDPGVVTETYTVAGTPASVFGAAWDPTRTANDMVKQSDGNYAWTSPSTVAAGTALEFKVAVNHAWTKSYGLNGGSSNVTYTMKATKKLKVLFNTTTHYVTAAEE